MSSGADDRQAPDREADASAAKAGSGFRVGDKVIATIDGKCFNGSVHWYESGRWYFIPEGGRVMHGALVEEASLRPAP